MGRARDTLEETGTVILDGAPGSGRSATARVLLREHHRPDGAFRELLPAERDELPLYDDPAFVDPGDRLLLDLSTAEAGPWHAARGGLPPCARRCANGGPISSSSCRTKGPSIPTCSTSVSRSDRRLSPWKFSDDTCAPTACRTSSSSGTTSLSTSS
ncbi:zeta toxin family protein [Streptomyces sp. Tue 6430]|nr:zeta toxin family protein [Streptomyces sp. Tue 6430]